MDSKDLSDTLSVNDVNLVMYVGILNKIDEVLGGFENLDRLPLDTALQSKIVDAVCSEYDSEGKVIGKKLEAFKLSASAFNEILQWALDHYSVFMLESSTKTLEKLKILGEEMEKFQKNS